MTNSKKHVLIGCLTLTVIIIALQLFSLGLIHRLSFWPEKIKLFELWRLFSAHLIHFNFLHCVVNLAVFWLFVFSFYWKLSSKILLTHLLVCCLGVDAGLFFGGPENQEYIGLSGALHGLTIAGAYANPQFNLKNRMLFIAIVLAKVIYENFYELNTPGLTEHYHFIVATEAHAYGAVSGLMIVFISIGFKFMSTSKNY